MIQITKYPKLSDETIRKNKTPTCCWFYTNETISDIEGIYDDNEHEIIFSIEGEGGDTTGTPELFNTKVVAENANFITICKSLYHAPDRINIILTYRKQYNDRRILQSGFVYMGEEEYKIKEFDFHYVEECYIGHCVYEKK